jgi:hypothetical protein
MKYLKYFENMNKQTYIIKWELEDISGDCSPSGKTTIDSGSISFDNIADKYSIIDEIIDNNSNSIKCKLYGILKTIENGEVIKEEDIDFS